MKRMKARDDHHRVAMEKILKKFQSVGQGMHHTIPYHTTRRSVGIETKVIVAYQNSPEALSGVDAVFSCGGKEIGI